MKSKDIDILLQNMVGRQKIKGQAEFIELLKAEGIAINQPTLSRRLKKLGIHKKLGTYTLPEPTPPTTTGVLPLSVASSEPNILVIHTLPGCAQALAFQIDELRKQKVGALPGFSAALGSVAGDDTIIVILPGSEALKALEREVREYFSL